MALCVENLSCAYGVRTIFEQVSFELKPGHVLAILGPNGVGKTTLFKSVLGFLPVQSGTIMLDGREIAGVSRAELAKSIAYVPQIQNLPFAYTIEDAVLMGRAPYLKLLEQPGAQDYEIAHRALASMGIEHLAKKPCTEVSGGELQMAVIARALAQEPKYLVMDEPTASLDFGNQVHVLERILELTAQGMGVMLTTHDPSQAFTLKSDVALMRRNQSLLVGYYRNVLTEDMLAETYGVEVLVRQLAYGEKTIDCCMALPKVATHNHRKGQD